MHNLSDVNLVKVIDIFLYFKFHYDYIDKLVLYTFKVGNRCKNSKLILSKFFLDAKF